jgi:hypothetical protein
MVAYETCPLNALPACPVAIVRHWPAARRGALRIVALLPRPGLFSGSNRKHSNGDLITTYSE